MAAAVSTDDGLLVGGEPLAILAASSALHEVAFRTDDVAVDLVQALGPAATTVATAAPFAPAQALAVMVALEAVVGPGVGLGHLASAYAVASTQLRAAGQALQLAGIAGLVGGGALALRDGPPRILADASGADLRREAMSVGVSGGPLGQTTSIGDRLVRRPDGTTFYVVELVTSPKASAGLGAQVNGFGGYVEAAAGGVVTLRWAVATADEARQLLAAVTAASVGGGEALSRLPGPTDLTVGTQSSATSVGTPLLLLATASAGLSVRNEVTLGAGGERLSTTISGAGQAGLLAVAGVGGAGALQVGVDRNRQGDVTRLSLVTSREVDRGRHGLGPLEALNREATLEEKEWELELTPELRARAERVADAIAAGRAPEEADLRALADAAGAAAPTVRTYDVRHQQLSGDIAIPGIGVGGSLGMDTATLRRP